MKTAENLADNSQNKPSQGRVAATLPLDRELKGCVSGKRRDR